VAGIASPAFTWLGRGSYEGILGIQHCTREDVLGGAPSGVLGCEHEPVYPLGRHARSSEVMRPGSAPVVRVDRGGRATWHGPGQAVIYPILRLRDFGLGVRTYVRALEEAAISWLRARGIEADRDPENAGVWIGDAKIAAVGVNVSKGVTTHGMALNVDPDLSAYERMVPCGLPFHRVTSLSELLGESPPPVEEVAREVSGALVELLLSGAR
jgi:lipoyl(octanoyl) transferase